MTLARRVAAESIGTAALLVAVVGSGIMGERLAHGNDAIVLLANSIATGCALWVLIATLGPISGAHFNPVVTVTFALRREFAWSDVAAYVVAQFVAALVGVALAHVMFGLSPWSASMHSRSGPGQWLGEVLATAGLIGVILLGGRHRASWVPGMVAVYITGAYWFTSSTSFANPAVTIARAATDSFAGIRPLDVPGFVVAQCIGALLALRCCDWLLDVRGRQT